jgi:hypothetical protein
MTKEGQESIENKNVQARVKRTGRSRKQGDNGQRGKKQDAGGNVTSRGKVEQSRVGSCPGDRQGSAKDARKG